MPIENIPTLNLPNHVLTELSIEPHGTVEKHPRLAQTSAGSASNVMTSEERDALEVARISQGLPQELNTEHAKPHSDSGYVWMASDD